LLPCWAVIPTRTTAIPRDPDRLGEALDEDRAKQADQHQGDGHLVPVHGGGQRVLHQQPGGRAAIPG
jgi:hypothetical protein